MLYEVITIGDLRPRAIRLIIRNVAGQKVGVTCQTTFGSPGRISGILFAEWEEKFV